MAKIYLKFSNDILEVTDDVLVTTRDQYNEALKSGTKLNLLFKTIIHKDGIWNGSLDEIKNSFNFTNYERQKHTFTDEAGIKNFHDLYGDIKASIVEGYGLVDRHTQFLIDSGQSELEDRGSHKVLRSLNKLKPETKEKLNDLWQEYNDKHKKDFE